MQVCSIIQLYRSRLNPLAHHPYTLEKDENCLFLQLVDLTAVDNIDLENRFELIYILLSHKKNDAVYDAQHNSNRIGETFDL